jgi:hypothetical protein
MTDVRREGFSLMEVILAMSILLGGVVVLGRLASIGAKHARTAEDLAAAQLLCEARITEILAGIIPAETLEEEPLSEAPDWVISQELLPLEQPGVVALSVTVTRAPEDLVSLATAPAQEQKEVSVTLVRWMLDPGIAQVGSMDSAAPAIPSSAGALSP